MGNQETACDRCGAEPDQQHEWREGDCVLPHRNHSRRLTNGSHVCEPCVERHRAWLTEIVELYATLADVVLAGSVMVDESGEYQKPRKAPASPSPLRLAAWAMLYGRLNPFTVDEDGARHDAYGGANLPDVPVVLAGWAQAAYDEQGWTATAPDTVAGAAAALQAAAGIIVRIPDIDTYDAELRWVRRALLHAHGKRTGGKQPVGRCPSLDGGGTECGGPLWPDPSGRMAVNCGRCERTFGEAFLRHLGGMMSA